MEKAVMSSGRGKVKEVWENNNNENNFQDYPYPYGYPWPPRCYSCNFCQREFKSAQALGGHMNIHRRDRARLRLRDHESPNNNPNYNPNNPNDQCPNPNNPNNPNNPKSIHFSPSSPPTNNNTNIYAHQYSLVSLSLSSLPPSSVVNGEKLNNTGGDLEQGFASCKDFYSLLGNHHHHHHHPCHEVRVFKSTAAKEFVKLDLELCLGEAKEELDLELRLGI